MADVTDAKVQMTQPTLNERAAKCMGWTFHSGSDNASEVRMMGGQWFYDPSRSLDSATVVRDRAIDVCGWNAYHLALYDLVMNGRRGDFNQMAHWMCLATAAQITEAACRTMEGA